MKRNFNRTLWDKIVAIDLTRVYQRLVCKLHFTEEQAKEAIDGYRKYLYLANTVGNLTPTPDVDEAWHAHILHLPTYVRDCMKAFGNVFWHVPKPIIEGKAICSGSCNVGECCPSCRGDGKAGTDCGDLQRKRVPQLTFQISVPVNEYVSENEEAPSYLNFVEEYFGEVVTS